MCFLFFFFFTITKDALFFKNGKKKRKNMLHGISSVTSFNFISVAVVKLVKKCTCLYRKKYVNPRHSPGDTLFQIVILMIHR